MRRKTFAIVMVLLWACIMMLPLTFLVEKTEASNVPAAIRGTPARRVIEEPTKTPVATAAPEQARATPTPVSTDPPEPFVTPPAATNDDAACYTCHLAESNKRAETARASTSAEPVAPVAPAPLVSTHGNQGYGSAWEGTFFLGCTQCHEAHGNTGNLKMVKQYVRVQSSPEITTGPVVFTAFTSTNSFDDGVSATVSRVCLTCHANTSNPGYPMTGHPGAAGHTLVDNNGNPPRDYVTQNCLDCHPHNGTNSYNGFMPVGGCVKCHASPVDQTGVGPAGGRRAIVPEFKNAAGGIRSHHVFSSTNPGTAIVTDADCIRCHKGEVTNKHADGYVKLSNVDTGQVYTETTPGAFRPANISNADSKALAPFCLACHDSNGMATKTVSPTIPFSSGNPVPDISGTLPISGVWSASAHATGGSTNTGYGCMNCHSDGHGSNLDNLLSPYTATLQAGNYNEEEGFCYKCHDGSVANRNIKTEFGYTSHHMVSDTEQFKGTVGRGVVECANCHNPHRSTKTQPLINPASRYTLWQDSKPERDFCLTCHVSTAPTKTIGISFTVAYSGTGWFKDKYLNSTHDKYLTGPSCRGCHNSHGSSIGTSLIISTYTKADPNGYVSSNFTLCWTCHRESVARGTTTAFEDLHTNHHDRFSCIHCHDPHNSYDANETGLIDFTYGIQKMDVTTRTGGTLSNMFTPGTPGCSLTCHGKGHTSENYTRSPQYSTNCNNCHNTAQGTRRAVTNNAGGEFARASHHVTPTLGTGLIYISNCTACHEFSTHQLNKSARLPLPNAAVGLKDPDTQRVIYYTGSGTVYQKALSLEPFCQGCHDNNGGMRYTNPLKPFSTTGKPISVSAHSNINFAPTASYPAALEAPFKVTCLQCHANHGSTNIRLITTTVLITGTTTTGPATFLRLTGANSFDDGASVNTSRICVTCHVNVGNPGQPMTSHTGGIHPAPIGSTVTQDCTTAGCHSHNPDKNSATADGFTATP